MWRKLDETPNDLLPTNSKAGTVNPINIPATYQGQGCLIISNIIILQFNSPVREFSNFCLFQISYTLFFETAKDKVLDSIKRRLMIGVNTFYFFEDLL